MTGPTALVSLVALVSTFAWLSSREQKRQRKIREAREKREEALRNEQPWADRDHELVAGAINSTEEGLRIFVGLRTFAEALDWDERAGRAIDLLRAASESLSTLKQRADDARRRCDESGEQIDNDVRSARNELTWHAIAAAEKDFHRINDLIEALAVRIDMTPNDAKDRTGLLKDLRFQKKELAAARKEERSKASEIR